MCFFLRPLMGSVTSVNADDVSLLLNNSRVDLLLTGLPGLSQSMVDQVQAINKLYSSHPQTSLGWSPSGRTLGPLASRNPAMPIRLYHMLLFTLPGTPIFSNGDEIGLKEGVSLADWINKWLQIHLCLLHTHTNIQTHKYM